MVSRWIESPHDWRPSSWTSARSNAKALCADPISVLRGMSLRPNVVRTTMARWRDDGATVSVVSGRFRILRFAIGWAISESLLETNPLAGMRGPPRPGTRMFVPIDDLRLLLDTAERLLEKAQPAFDGSMRTSRELHRAEELRLSVRLAADSGARRGELAALKFTDLDERVLTIERGVSAEQVGPPRQVECVGSRSGRRRQGSGASARRRGMHGRRLPRHSARGCSPDRLTTESVSRPARWATGSRRCVTKLACLVSGFIYTRSPRSSSAEGTDLGHSSALGTATRRQPSGTTRTHCRSRSSTPQTASTRCSEECPHGDRWIPAKGSGALDGLRTQRRPVVSFCEDVALRVVVAPS